MCFRNCAGGRLLGSGGQLALLRETRVDQLRLPLRLNENRKELRVFCLWSLANECKTILLHVCQGGSRRGATSGFPLYAPLSQQYKCTPCKRRQKCAQHNETNKRVKKKQQPAQQAGSITTEPRTLHAEVAGSVFISS